MYARFFLFVLILKYIRQIIRISNDDKKIKKCIKHEICFFFRRHWINVCVWKRLQSCKRNICCMYVRQEWWKNYVTL